MRYSSDQIKYGSFLCYSALFHGTSRHDTNADGTTAAESHHAECDDAVDVDEFARFPLIWCCTIGNESVINSKSSRADRSDFPPSQDHASDQPCEWSTNNRAANQAVQHTEACGFCGGMSELEQGHHNERNVDDESPQEPFVELLAHIGISWFCRSVSNCVSGFGPAGACVGVAERIGVEEIGEYTIDDKVSGSHLTLGLGVVHLGLHVKFSLEFK